MNMLAFFIFLTVVTLLGAFAAVRLDIRAIKRHSVSTVSLSDYRLSWTQIGVSWAALIVTVALLVILAAMEASALTGIAVVAIFGLIRGAMTMQTEAAARVSKSVRLAEALDAPEIANACFAFYFSGVGYKNPLHFYMWEDYMQPTGKTLLLVLRERKHFVQIKNIGHTTAILVKDKIMLEMFASYAQNISAIFYANNSIYNTAVIKSLPEKLHVQLLHGDSDKPPSYSPLVKNYDLVFVAGQMAIDRYALNGVDIPAERFRIVGRPQVAAIKPVRVRTPETPLEIGYMPTWRGFYEDTQFSSLDRAAQIIKTIHNVLPNARITFKPHPLSDKDPLWPRFKHEVSSALSSVGAFASDDATPFDLYNQSDILITDISSVMLDFLYSGKPFLVVQPECFDPSETRCFPSLAASYQVTPGLENLAEMLSLATTDDPLHEQRVKTQYAAFGDFDRPPGDAFRDACFALLKDEGSLNDKEAENG